MDVSFTEYADMHLRYGACNGNGDEAARKYRVCFPNRTHPTAHVFRRLDQRLRETANYRNASGPRRRRTIQVEEQIIDSVSVDPPTSTRQLTATMNISSHKTVHSVLKENLLKPFHVVRVQPLIRTNFASMVTKEGFLSTFGGPIYLPNRLDAAEYLNVLQEVLDDMPLNLRHNMLYMHDFLS
ncbi:transposable element tc3 transposase-like protein [Holotrichia oblita]|uniref:Transposable element tc3 transposase-like protein n=1 Tax=Holotrichia oblita TaxID=644536 RepID=A0ACB9TIE4_HOLOL|nr:transposable element tc3 transposase-like protein [Holotrichia oblita]